MSATDSVLLIAFGGPEQPEDVRPFPPGRLEAVARHYDAIGGRSPLNELTRRQAAGLAAALAAAGDARGVYVGMRNWPPLIGETLGEMRARGHRRARGIILS